MRQHDQIKDDAIMAPYQINL